MQHSKMILFFILLVFVSFSNIQGVGLEDALAMNSVEFEEYLKERSTQEIKELRRLIILERSHELKKNRKYKIKCENATYHLHVALVAEGLSLLVIYYSLKGIGNNFGPTPENFEAMSPESKIEIFAERLVEAVMSVAGLSFLCSCVFVTIPPLYTLINRYFPGKVQRKRISSFERLLAIIKLEEIVNQALAEGA